MMTKRITIIEVKDYVGQEVTIGAWVANKSGKGKIAFFCPCRLGFVRGHRLPAVCGNLRIADFK